MNNSLGFEKPVIELENKIAELEEFAKSNDVNLSNEIDILKKKLDNIKDEVYTILSRLHLVQVWVILHYSINKACLY